MSSASSELGRTIWLLTKNRDYTQNRLSNRCRLIATAIERLFPEA